MVLFPPSSEMDVRLAPPSELMGITKMATHASALAELRGCFHMMASWLHFAGFPLLAKPAFSGDHQLGLGSLLLRYIFTSQKLLPMSSG